MRICHALAWLSSIVKLASCYYPWEAVDIRPPSHSNSATNFSHRRILYPEPTACDASVILTRSIDIANGTITVYHPQLYTKAEVLGADDAWHCPHCNLKQEVIKKLGLWTLPDILVVHLKRFRQTSASKQQVVRSEIISQILIIYYY